MTAIVYCTKRGSAKEYAQKLGEMTSLPVYDLKTAAKSLKKGEPIIYIGWVCAGKVKGLEKAAARYKIKKLGMVGVSPDESSQKAALASSGAQTVAVLPGRIRPTELRGFDGMVIRMVSGMLKKAAEDHPEDKDAAKLADVMCNGADLVDFDKLNGLI